MATRRMTPQISFEVAAAETVQAPIDDTLTIAGEAADAKATGDAIVAANVNIEALGASVEELETALGAEEAAREAADALKVNKPTTSPDGSQGQLLMSNGDGSTTWSNAGTPSDQQVGTAVSTWLTEHPEATTTVQDGVISRAKLDADLKAKTDDVPSLKSAFDDNLSDINYPLSYVVELMLANENKRLKADGTMETMNGYSTSNFIPCLPGDKIKYKIATYSGRAIFATYSYANESTLHDKILGNGTTPIEGTYTFTESDHFFKISGYTSRVSEFEITYNKLPAKITEIVNPLTNKVSNLEDITKSNNSDVIRPLSYEKSLMLAKENTRLTIECEEETQTGYATSEYIPCTPGDSVHIKIATYNNKVCFATFSTVGGVYRYCTLGTGSNFIEIDHTFASNEYFFRVSGYTGIFLYSRYEIKYNTFPKSLQTALDEKATKETPDNYPLYYVTNQNQSNVENTGIKLRFATLNIGRYNHGNTSATGYVASDFDEKIFAVRKALMEINADIIGLQEDAEYCDRELTKESQNYIYKPIYPTRVKTTDSSVLNTIYSRGNNTSSGEFTANGVTENTVCCYAKYNINNKVLLFVCCHPGPAGNAGLSNRLAQYANIFNWIASQTYDYCVIVGDFNNDTDDDRNPAIENTIPYLCARDEFSAANGGYLGWLYTQGTLITNQASSIDNILVSNNIIINRIECLSSIDVSDHFPLYVDVTLT